jgi:hypothetical protein
VLAVQETVTLLLKHASFGSGRDQPRDGAPGYMRRINYKALMAILTIGRRSKKNIDWTLAIAIFSTVVTVGLILLYVWQGRPDPQ